MNLRTLLITTGTVDLGTRKKMKPISSKRAKAVAIPPRVKRKVAERDEIDGWTCCVVCGSPKGIPEAHYIPRSKGGLGIEKNIVTLCRPCHYKFDFGNKEDRSAIGSRIKEYLESIYPDWNEEELVYKK